MKFRAMTGCAALAALAVLAALGGCGVIYTVPGVYDGGPHGEPYGTDFDLEVVPMTYETAMAANLVPYVPPRLPAAFQPGQQAALASSTAAPELDARPARATARRARPLSVSSTLPPERQPEPYRIGVGDVLLLSISGAQTLDRLPDLLTAQAKRDGYTVQDNGTISIPDAGRAQVAGMTLQEAEDRIAQMLLASNIEPSFSLEVAEFNSQHVAVDGQVGQPGLVPITLQPLRLYEALARAGGIDAEDPGLATIQLLRDGAAYRYGADRYINDPAVRGIPLRDGDSIHVAVAEEILDEGLSWREQVRAAEEKRIAREEERLAKERALFEQRLALGAVERYYVFLTGEVRVSGEAALPFEQPIHLANVLFGNPGGGINIQFGDFGAIYVIRSESDPLKAGGLTAYHLDAENVANLAVAARFEMRPNDIVFVAEQPVTSWNRVLAQLLPVFSLPERAVATATGVP